MVAIVTSLFPDAPLPDADRLAILFIDEREPTQWHIWTYIHDEKDAARAMETARRNVPPDTTLVFADRVVEWRFRDV